MSGVVPLQKFVKLNTLIEESIVKYSVLLKIVVKENETVAEKFDCKLWKL